MLLSRSSLHGEPFVREENEQLSSHICTDLSSCGVGNSKYKPVRPAPYQLFVDVVSASSPFGIR